MSAPDDFDVDAQIVDDIGRKWDDLDNTTATSLALSPATITVTSVAQGVTPGAATPALTPATVTVTGQALATSNATTIALTPATVTVTPVALGTSSGALTAALTPATVTVAAQALALTNVAPTTTPTPTQTVGGGPSGRRGPYQSLPEPLTVRDILLREDEELLCLV